MSLPNAEETALLQLIFNATTWANIATNATSSPYSSLYLTLHTSDPGEAGNQSTNGAAYTSYAYKSTARTTGAGGWAVTNDTANLVDSTTDFAQATGGSETETHFGIGGAPSGTGRLIMSGTVSPPLVVATGTTPQLTSSTAVTAS